MQQLQATTELGKEGEGWAERGGQGFCRGIKLRRVFLPRKATRELYRLRELLCCRLAPPPGYVTTGSDCGPR